MKPEKVLVVDHSEMMRKMYVVMLRSYPLTFAGDRQEALDRLEQHPDTDLVLLDLHMPTMNPLEFLQQLGADDRWKSLPVIVVATEDREADVARAIDLGARAAVTKPFQAEQLLHQIAALD